MLSFFIYKDVDGQYRFRLRGANSEILAVSEAYHNKVDCAATIELIRRGAAASSVHDMTVKP